ncbi:aldehyde dehydrogenase family protein, partial [Rhizobium phaseoli]|uniref:aldehyde dehydrogenase family protein n=1 Tax=Rhizobium phaseoli TaxID=396 RepID=UPI0014366E97
SGPGEVGAALVDNPQVDKIMFTGSGSTGAKIAAIAARHLTPTTMELGGNDAAIVLSDVDPKTIAMGLFWGAFINMGQT